MIETIKGTSNICNIQYFCDPEKISSKNFGELELNFILKNPTPKLCDLKEILKKINELTKTNFADKTNFYPEQKVEEFYEIDEDQPVAPEIEMNPVYEGYNSILYDNVETQKQQVEKMQILESIQCLKDELIKLKIPVDEVPTVNSSSSYNDIKSVYNILRYKKNININSDIAKEIIIVGIKQLACILNGRKTSWGRMPDLRGWDRTAKTKLNSLKVELSSIVAGFFDHYGIGNLGQILLSLVPSAIVHMADRSEQRPEIDIKAEESLQNLFEMKN